MQPMVFPNMHPMVLVYRKLQDWVISTSLEIYESRVTKSQASEDSKTTTFSGALKVWNDELSYF